MRPHEHRFACEQVGEYRPCNSTLVKDWQAVCDCGWRSALHEREVHAWHEAQRHRASVRTDYGPAEGQVPGQLGLF